MTGAILILAAGASSRMRGGDKLLEPVNGRPLIAEMARRALGVCDRVMITLPALDHPRAAALIGLSVDLIPVPDAAEGMAASIRAGISGIAYSVSFTLILPGDMPDISQQDVDLIYKNASAHPDEIVRATNETGTPGHPVAFPARLFPDLQKLRGDEGARSILKSEKPVMVPLPGDHATTDLDTPEAWAEWRARKPEV
jgi:CTP:molybdopterin cytidylyltransferase MocA